MEKIEHKSGMVSYNMMFLNDRQKTSLSHHLKEEEVQVFVVTLLPDDMRIAHAHKKGGTTDVFEFTMLQVSSVHDLANLV